MKRFIALALSCLLFCSAQASTLLFVNNVPPDLTGPALLNGVATIAAAIDAGAKLRVSITLPENGGQAHFYVDAATAKCSVGFPTGYSNYGIPVDPNPAGTLDYCSVIVNVRPKIDNWADAIAPSPMISGSLNTLGDYWYNNGSVLQVQHGYITAWYAD